MSMNTCAGNARRGVDRCASRLDRRSGHRPTDLLHRGARGLSPRIKPFFEAAERNEFRIVTSFVTLVEVLVHPLREGRPELAEEYRDILLRSPALTAIPLDEGIAEEAAELRARHNLRTPDAIQIATAIRSGASWFLTNDAALANLSEISVLVLKQLP